MQSDIEKILNKTSMVPHGGALCLPPLAGVSSRRFLVGKL